MRIQTLLSRNTLNHSRPLAFGVGEPETREERAARRAVRILLPVLNEDLQAPDNVFLSQTLRRFWATPKPIRTSELTVNGKVIAAYGYYPPLDRVAQMDLHRSVQEKKREPFDSRHSLARYLTRIPLKSSM